MGTSTVTDGSWESGATALTVPSIDNEMRPGTSAPGNGVEKVRYLQQIVIPVLVQSKVGLYRCALVFNARPVVARILALLGLETGQDENGRICG
jgi:hypothetical protein